MTDRQAQHEPTASRADVFLGKVIDPGLAWATADVGGALSRPAARRFLLAIAIQETALTDRAQRLAGGAAGPARGWWQFEQPTIGLLLAHRVSGDALRRLCASAWVRPEPAAIWRAIEGHDLLAVGVARLLMLTDPYPVPETEAAAWQCYALRLWRPGKPHPGKWPDAWRVAGAAVVADAARAAEAGKQ